MWGVLATLVYDAVRLDTVYLLGWWGDFIPRVGTWILGSGSAADAGSPVVGAVVGYLWRYVGDGGGIGVAFFVLVAATGLRRWGERATVAASVTFAVFPVWTGPRRHGGAGPARAAADVPADAGHRAPLARRAPRVRPRAGAGVRPLPPPRGVLALDAPARPAAGRRARGRRRSGPRGPTAGGRRPSSPPAGTTRSAPRSARWRRRGPSRARRGGARPRPLDPASGPVRVLDMPPGPAPVVRAGPGPRRTRADRRARPARARARGRTPRPPGADPWSGPVRSRATSSAKAPPGRAGRG